MIFPLILEQKTGSNVNKIGDRTILIGFLLFSKFPKQLTNRRLAFKFRKTLNVKNQIISSNYLEPLYFVNSTDTLKFRRKVS